MEILSEWFRYKGEGQPNREISLPCQLWV